ncbi:AAA family ATPase [Pseudobacteroides cellulosolvens]|uniref:AAA domain containing protein n=1 Tax=Pseudobacteroides cellulosolvens ATCC 35603 = DSM 2933 TaxID=398512 RepID=A0A0L6JH64_9FIRM|nr:AAA family ATPase [Pseudobacteroides cellulosolvens]KNY25064.1 AAA domain containing protein [Pseudobacteroides cellulosolvens ATCC 35603 = DSM 2933]
MSKLNLVIADSDEEYLNGVVGFLSEKYLERFKILSFSDKESLINFISTYTEKLDILLISPELYFEEISKKRITLVGILSTGRLSKEFKGCEIVHKYQLGENLVKNIINLYSDKSSDIIITKGQKETKVVAVYSSNGGSGKTTISYGCSLKSVQLGRTTFYMNLEESASTPILFGTSGQYNLSHVLYYLKSRNKSLSLKIEGIKVTDQDTGVHYFNPPENHLELLDIEPSEYFNLLNHMKEMNQYEVIYVDMPCFIEKRMMAVLDVSDIIFYILNPNHISKIKLHNFLSELDTLDRSYKQKTLSKTVFILNKAFNEEQGIEIFNDILGSIEKNISHTIPESSKLFTHQNGRIVLDLSGKFGSALGEVIERNT